MNPYVFKISQLLVVTALKTLIILMVLIPGVVHSGPVPNKACGDLQPVKPAAFYNLCSKNFLGVKKGKEVVADIDNNRTLFTVTVNSYGFLIFDPTANMFLCWKRNKKSSRLVPRRNPKDISVCIFEELPEDAAHTKYVSSKHRNLVMSFRSDGSQRIGKKMNTKRKVKCQPEAFMRVASKHEQSCLSSYDEFCSKMQKIRHHKIKEEIRHLCNMDKSPHLRKKSM